VGLRALVSVTIEHVKLTVCFRNQILQSNETISIGAFDGTKWKLNGRSGCVGLDKCFVSWAKTARLPSHIMILLALVHAVLCILVAMQL